ncbi:Predicted metal-dependent hydrolase, TIM-barrel fold [Micromonospora rhizosphaerae]|uniref:Predicted metal-dependent hydrolase, TIM-barrel fold n=1 Tax=Micromonospora rhizosphaerae TaxID=568872 RepID=A0A1C6SBI3_9ACTN|nr:amidohydrolase family protein [Micromonospora rhizosphaerae]SCL26642.1 Predicted metal-dependent hydrolase, TIM-barrel fold [Micromonospora rhizosphaerae]
MNLYDCNSMLGRLPAGNVGEGSVAALTKLMDRFGIEAAVVAHTAAWRHDPASGNAQLLAEVSGEPRLRPAWVGLPDSCGEVAPPAQFVAAARRHDVAAVRLYPADHGYGLAGSDCAALLDALAAARLPVLIDADQASMTEIEAIAAARPALPVVVCQVGYRALRRLAGVLARTGNVHVELSYLGSHLGLEWLVERFGSARLLFGTGLPVRDPADAVTRLLWSELDDAEVAAIGAGNLRRLVGGGDPC